MIETRNKINRICSSMDRLLQLCDTKQTIKSKDKEKLLIQVNAIFSNLQSIDTNLDNKIDDLNNQITIIENQTTTIDKTTYLKPTKTKQKSGILRRMFRNLYNRIRCTVINMKFRLRVVKNIWFKRK